MTRHKKITHPVAVTVFLLYLGILFHLLFFSEAYGRTMKEQEYRYNLQLFREIRRFWMYRREIGLRTVCINLLGNIAAFVPFGFYVPMLRKRVDNIPGILLCSAGFSLLVETLQLVFRVGAFDVDDIILNTLGGILGYLLFSYGYKRVEKRKKL